MWLGRTHGHETARVVEKSSSQMPSFQVLLQKTSAKLTQIRQVEYSSNQFSDTGS
jgi:hypothetical protein